MLATQSDVQQHIAKHGAKQLTALDNTGLYCNSNSNNYSKKIKKIVLAQQAKIVKKAKVEQ